MNQDKTTEQVAEEILLIESKYEGFEDLFDLLANAHGGVINRFIKGCMQSYADHHTATLTATIEAQREVIERLKNPWISVKDELPLEYMSVMVNIPNLCTVTNKPIGWYVLADEINPQWWHSGRVVDVTDWMPIPPSPLNK